MKIAIWAAPACLVLIAAVGCAPSGAYPRGDLLLEPAELAKPAAMKQLVILDARSRDEYDKEHIPGAIPVDFDVWKSAFGQGTDAEGWGKRIAETGIGGQSKVVIYDAKDSVDAARIWWILRYWGLRDARLLNGGWQAWTAAKLPTATEATAVKPAASFQATPAPARMATKQQMLDLLKEQPWQIVDARSNDEYCGIDKKNNKRGGAMPGAKHLDWVDLIDKSTHRFKPAPELHKLFSQAGIALDRPTASYCQSGGRASVMAFALALMGAKDVRNYYQSWQEWRAADDTPILTPDTPAGKDAPAAKDKPAEKDKTPPAEKKA